MRVRSARAAVQRNVPRSARDSRRLSSGRLARGHRGVAPVAVGIVITILAVVLIGGLFASGVIRPGGGGGEGAAVKSEVIFREEGIQEGGLAAPPQWSVTLNDINMSSTSAEIAFEEPNGTYNFTVGPVQNFNYSWSPTSGSVRVVGYTQFIIVHYTMAPPNLVTFSQNGLATGTEWSVTLSGLTKNSTESNITFAEPDGEYSYTVGPVAGYTSSPASGTLNLSGGQEVSQTVAFSPVTDVPRGMVLPWAECSAVTAVIAEVDSAILPAATAGAVYLSIAAPSSPVSLS